jgi:hypothetical protein
MLTRDILHSDGSHDAFEGEATFHRSGPRLIQDEYGWLTSDRSTAPMKATRRYVWSASGNRVDVAFEDMRPFHSLSLGSATPCATYLCPPDRYEVSYDFREFPDWSTVWVVEGPRKNYRMTSQFRRNQK